MAITEYVAFVTQMHNLAVMAESRDNAYRAADDKNEGKDLIMNISGIWEADPDSYDPEGAERMLEHGELTRFGSGTYAIGDIACCMHAERTAARACEERPAKMASAKRAALANPPDSPVRAALFALTPPLRKVPVDVPQDPEAVGTADQRRTANSDSDRFHVHFHAALVRDEHPDPPVRRHEGRFQSVGEAV